MVRRKLPDLRLRGTPERIQLLQCLDALLLQHLYKFFKNLCRTARIVHGTVMIFQRNAKCFRNRIKLEPVQLLQKNTCHRDGIHNCFLTRQTEPAAILLDKAHIK